LDCDFVDTDHGPFFQGHDGPVHDNLVTGLVCENMVHTENACEGIALESAPGADSKPVHDNLFLHIRYQGDVGIVLWRVNAFGNYFRDFVLDGGSGIVFGGGQTQFDNTLLDGEVRGGRCALDQSATRTVMQRVAFIGPRPSRSNQYNDVADPSPTAVITNFAQNPGIDFPPYANPGTVKFARLLDGWSPTQDGP